MLVLPDALPLEQAHPVLVLHQELAWEHQELALHPCQEQELQVLALPQE
jgi:hypothetical protein